MKLEKLTAFAVVAVLCQKRLKAGRPKLKACLPIVLSLCLFSVTLMAQDIRPLKVGDKLPEAFWQQEHTVYADGRMTQQTLAKYKGKLLILDFWATWCSSCLQQFGKLDRLQRANADEVAIVLVSKNRSDKDSEKVKQSFDKYAKGMSLTTLVGDDYLGRLFPHWQLPFYVWINAKGQVMAFTDSTLLSEVGLVQALHGKQQKEVAP